MTDPTLSSVTPISSPSSLKTYEVIITIPVTLRGIKDGTPPAVIQLEAWRKAYDDGTWNGPPRETSFTISEASDPPDP